MFWSSQMGFEEREIDKKLKAKDIDLNSILDDMHCLQEIRNSNEQLLIFLKRDDNFRTLVNSVLITEENADDGRQPKDKYRFAHQCCEALCIGAREFYPELEKHKDLLQKMANFLAENSGRLNPLTVSFYGRTLISFLSTEPEKFIAVLESSNFLDGSFYCLGNSSIFELLCTIPNCMPDPVFRDRVKKWYLEKEFTQKMLDLLSPNQPSNTHENVAALWVEFVKALREYQYNVEQAPDLLLDSIQSEENVAKLLAQMFPPEGIEFTPSIVANGALVLNALLETNQIRNSPSALLAQEAQNIANDNSLTDLQPTFSLNSTENTISSTSQLMMDTERMVETRCAEHASDIITCIIYGLKAIELNQKATATKMNASSHQEQHNNSSFKDSANALAKLKLVDYEDSPIKVVDYSDSVATDNDAEEEHIDMNTRMEDFCGDVLNNCMQLLINLTNTNFLPTHLELCRAFANQNNSLSLLFEHVEVNPSCSIFNAQLMTLVLHIFYSSTGPTQRPLIDFIIKDFNLPGFIVRVLPDWMLDDEEADSSTAVPKHIPLSKRLFCVAKRSFFMHLANRLRHAESGSPNAEYIREMIQELPNYKQWEDFCSASVQSFVDHNRSEKMNSYSTIARTSNTIEIDELPEDNFLTLDTSPPPPHLSSSSSS